MNPRAFGVILACCASIPVALATGYVAAAMVDADPKPPPAPHWIYSEVQVLGTKQKGVVVKCQEKTNSRPFGERRFAKPGDVVIQTCRAVRG